MKFRVSAWLFCVGLQSFVASGCVANRPEPRQRALLLLDKGNHEAAEQVLEKHLAEHPRAVPERRLLIRVLGLLGQFGRARAEARTLAEQLGDGSPVPWIELGHALEFSHRYDEALAMYDRASDVAPKDATGPRTAGLRAARWDEPELAEPRLIEALRRNSRDSEVWHVLGLVRLKRRNLAGAEAAYRAGLKADPQALENRIGLATIAIIRRDAKLALAEYDLILAARPSFADAYLGRAWALMRLRRYAEAAEALETGKRRGANPRAVAEQNRLLDRLRALGDRAQPY